MTIAISPAMAHISCLNRNSYADPKRSLAITAEALKIMTSPIKTSIVVTVNIQRSTLTRLAMGRIHFTTDQHISGPVLAVNYGKKITDLVRRGDGPLGAGRAVRGVRLGRAGTPGAPLNIVKRPRSPEP